MAHSHTYETIILQTHDVGEADRFLILFTRERGRLAARARAVRKPKSKIGGSLLPLHHLAIDLTESKSGFMVTGTRQSQRSAHAHDLASYLQVQQATEMLLHVLHEEEPMPELFDAYLELLTKPEETSLLLSFTVRLLSLLGILPEHTAPLFAHFSDAGRRFVRACSQAPHLIPHALPKSEANQIARTCEILLSEQTGKQLKVGQVSAGILSTPPR